MVPSLDEPFDVVSFARSLEGTGLDAGDAQPLARYNEHHFRRTTDDTSPIRAYLPHILLPDGRPDDEALRLVMKDLLQTEARGPLEGPYRDVWLTTYVEGCPMDHIWPLFRYCTSWEDEHGEESTQPAPPDVARRRAEEQVRLLFPRSAGPWPGYGCETTVRNATGRVDALLASWPGASRFVFANELLRVWHVLSPYARAAVDAAAPLPLGLRRSIEQADVASIAPFLEGGFDEDFDPRAVGAWLHALSDSISRDTLAHDVATDRYVVPQERCAARIERPGQRRAIGPPDRGVSDAVVAIVAGYRPETSTQEWRQRKVSEDPLAWIDSARDLLREEPLS